MKQQQLQQYIVLLRSPDVRCWHLCEAYKQHVLSAVQQSPVTYTLFLRNVAAAGCGACGVKITVCCCAQVSA
jgi:hypothetical protein